MRLECLGSVEFVFRTSAKNLYRYVSLLDINSHAAIDLTNIEGEMFGMFWVAIVVVV